MGKQPIFSLFLKAKDEGKKGKIKDKFICCANSLTKDNTKLPFGKN